MHRHSSYGARLGAELLGARQPGVMALTVLCIRPSVLPSLLLADVGLSLNISLLSLARLKRSVQSVRVQLLSDMG